MINRVEEFVYDMLVNVLNAKDTAPIAVAEILSAGSWDPGPEGIKIEDPDQWTPDKIIKRAASMKRDRGPAGDFDD